MNWFLEQNEWTGWIFAFSILVDFWAARRVDKHVHNPKLYLVLLVLIVFGLIINGVHFIDDTLYNIAPIGTMIIVFVMCKVHVDIHEDNEEKTKRIISHLIKTNTGSKKQVCKKHYERIMSEDFKDACPDCPLLE